MGIVSRIWEWLGRFGHGRSVIVSQAVDPTRRPKVIDDQQQREIDFLKKVLASVANTKLD